MAEDNKTNTPLENEPEVVFNSQSDRRFFRSNLKMEKKP